MKNSGTAPHKQGNGTAAPPPPSGTGSIFDDAESLKKSTAAKLGKLRASAETASAEVILQRPLSTWFFRTPEDDGMLFSGGTWQDPETKELYFVVPEMWGHSQLEGAVRPTLFVPYVTAATEGPSVHGIWPVSTAMGNTYTDSVHSRILPASRVAWVRTWTSMTAKKYLCQKAEDDYGEPIWLAKTIFEQLGIVFPRKRQIQADEDEIIGRLKGRKRTNTQDPDPDAN
jgi:hypothetical protein